MNFSSKFAICLINDFRNSTYNEATNESFKNIFIRLYDKVDDEEVKEQLSNILSTRFGYEVFDLKIRGI